MWMLRRALLISVAPALLLSSHVQASWRMDGVILCQLDSQQSAAAGTGDGQGGAIAIWVDNSDLFAQRIDATGNIQWGPVGVPVCTAAGEQMAPAAVPDGNGGAIIIWQDHRGGTAIYAQRLNHDGIAQWASNGVPLAPASGGWCHRACKVPQPWALKSPHPTPMEVRDGGGRRS